MLSLSKCSDLNSLWKGNGATNTTAYIQEIVAFHASLQLPLTEWKVFRSLALKTTPQEQQFTQRNLPNYRRGGQKTHTLLAKSHCKMDIWNQPGGFPSPGRPTTDYSCSPPPHPHPPAATAWYNLLWQKGRFKILSSRFQVFSLNRLGWRSSLTFGQLSQFLTQLDLANSSGKAFSFSTMGLIQICEKKGAERGGEKKRKKGLFNNSESWRWTRLLPMVSLTTLQAINNKLESAKSLPSPSQGGTIIKMRWVASSPVPKVRP